MIYTCPECRRPAWTGDEEPTEGFCVEAAGYLCTGFNNVVSCKSVTIANLRVRVSELEKGREAVRVAVERARANSAEGDAEASLATLLEDLIEELGLLKRRELDEELQQIDDAVVKAGGDKDHGAGAFISTLAADLKRAESVIDDRNAELARVRGELAEATQQVRTVINRDQSGLAAGLLHVKAIAQGYMWIPENHWGSYEADAQGEDVLREETGNLIRGVVDGCMRYLRASGKRADEAATFRLEAPVAETPAVESGTGPEAIRPAEPPRILALRSW